MPHTGNSVRLADFTVRLFLSDDILADEDQLAKKGLASI
jgi:hypothetical protein